MLFVGHGRIGYPPGRLLHITPLEFDVTLCVNAQYSKETSMRVEPDLDSPGELDITIHGPWLHTILYEIPILAIVSEVYFRRTQPGAHHRYRQRRRG